MVFSAVLFFKSWCFTFSVFSMGCVNSRHSQPSLSASRQKVNELLSSSYENYKELVVELEKMMEYRAETIEHMNSVADELDKRHCDTNIAKIVGSSTAAGAAAVAAVSIVLIPFTGGASAAVAIGATVAASATMAAGTATTIGAHITEKVMENVDLSRQRQGAM